MTSPEPLTEHKRRTAPPLDVIVDAAAELFGAKGYHDTRMQEIADRAGIAKPTLYVYAKNKLALLEAVYERVMNETLEALGRVEELTDPQEQLRALVQAWIDIGLTHRASAFVFFAGDYFAGDATLPTELSQRYRRWGTEVLHRVRRIVEAGQKTGAIRADLDATTATFALVSATQWTMRWWREGGSLDRATLVRNHIELFERGLLTTST
ncbi:MAG TPA: TetR/AcrR family transcriptional regulator [Nonomuraea sp.]|nr:TetR/AcrR family transcriptional regulator [Nonomuraea sp.]